MAESNAEFLKRLLATFKVEADEHLRAVSSGLIELERAPESERQAEIVESVFRETHSLKGAARSVNLAEVEAICQALESAFAALKRREIVLSRELLDLLHQAVDHVAGLVASPEGQPRSLHGDSGGELRGQPAAEARARHGALIERLRHIAEGGVPLEREPVEALAPAARPAAVEEKAALPETVRISAAKLDALLLETEELIAAKQMFDQRLAELRELGRMLAGWKSEWARVQPEARALQHTLSTGAARDDLVPAPASPTEARLALANVARFLEWQAGYLAALENRLAALTPVAEQDRRTLERMVDGLLGDMKRVVMLPVSSLLGLFPKLVRDLARDQGKELELMVHGAEIELDKRLLEEMKDPLVHLVRNCVDHGVERPEVRARKHKPPRGTIRVAFESKNSSHVEIRISDDGAGIDTAGVRAAALKSGLWAPEELEKLDERAILQLVFRSGISTSPIVTDLSGRGLGLAIVREKVEQLGGAVAVETSPDAGTTFRLLLPMTLATFRGLLVRVGERLFVIPIAHVERAIRVKPEDIKTVENRETIRLGGETLSLARLGDVLALPPNGAPANSLPAVVLAHAGERLAFAVDEVLADQEVLVKSLGPQLARVRNVAAATVLGNGQVVPILNVPDLMQSAAQPGVWPTKPAAPAEAARRSILVVEDSITARVLLKNILESAGYLVGTAVDGLDAYTQLRSEEFDLVVSDVEMPRLDGFGLTEKIRADKKLAELPVVLVTALETREDRERGIDAGANAYIVKSSFDQSNLLDVIRRFI